MESRGPELCGQTGGQVDQDQVSTFSSIFAPIGISNVPIISRGGSFLVGEVILEPDGDYKHHGDVVFLYPDLSTAIRGQWSRGRLSRGHEARVTSVTWSRGLPAPVTSHVPGAGAVFSYQPSGSLCISKSPMLRDPYEARQVYVAQSQVRLVQQLI